MNGKSKCKILKDIRKKIAEDNDIAYVTSECKYQGECSGTCPKCEAELRYLEEELNKRRNLGKTVAVAGIAAALVVGSTGCVSTVYNQTAGSPPPADHTTYQTGPSTTEPVPSGIPSDETTHPTDGELSGDPVDYYPYPTEDVLMGDIPLIEDPAWWD